MKKYKRKTNNAKEKHDSLSFTISNYFKLLQQVADYFQSD